MNNPEANTYLGEVLEKQQQVDQELRRKVRSSVVSQQQALPPAPGRGGGPRQAASAPAAADGGGRAIDTRITGLWRFKTVVVPPNVYVVHTRRGRDKPLHVGMGQSFRFNPYTDAFLVIPAAMQTIVINARCICVERQGILVQAYVQWIIDDIETAYRKLDFSDLEDPMNVVNVQLREQAEAAIKDKVATMHIDEVLADKQPIIEELTLRLRAVAEGSRESGASGLGLKIVTVQIKEAVVSSTRVWENLQKPFRAERERLARMAELEAERQIAERELEIRQARETAEIATEGELAKQRALKERELYDRTQAEKERRAKLEQEAERLAIHERNATEKAKRDAELELQLKALEVVRQRTAAELETLAAQQKVDAAAAARQRAQAEQDTALEEHKSKAQALLLAREVEHARAQRAVDNDLSDGHLRARLIAALPEIAAKLPQPDELRSVTIAGDGGNGAAASLTSLVASLLALLENRSAPEAAKNAPPARRGKPDAP